MAKISAICLGPLSGVAVAACVMGAPLGVRASVPVISNVEASLIGPNTAKITWTTDVEADSRVDYGYGTPPQFNQYVMNIFYVTEHSLTLFDLEECTQYYFYVSSENLEGSTTDNNAGKYYSFVNAASDCYHLIVGPVLWKDHCGEMENGLAEPGETLDVAVDLASAAAVSTPGVVVSLESLTSGVTVRTPAQTDPFDLPPWDPSQSFPKVRAGFQVDLDRGLACGQEISLRLHVTSNETGEELQTIRFLVGSISDALSEDFTEPADLDQHPTGWRITDGGDLGDTWTRNNPALCNRDTPGTLTAPFEILDSDCFGEEGEQNDALETPVVDCSSADFVELIFDTLFFCTESALDQDQALVEVSDDGGDTWSEVCRWGITVGEPPGDFDAGGGEAVQVNLDLSPWAAGKPSVRVRFRYVGAWGWYWYVDNVRIRARSASSSCSMTVCCDRPSGLSAPSAEDVGGVCTDSGVKISWAANPTTWGDEGVTDPYRGYRVLRNGEDVSGFLPFGTTSFMDTGGSDNIPYDYKVRYENDCGVTGDTEVVSGMDLFAPATPTILGGSTNVCPSVTVALSTETGMSSYQWYLNGNPVGTNSSTYEAAEGGTYTVSYVNGQGCSGTSEGHEVALHVCAAAPVADGRDGTAPLLVSKGTDGTLAVTYDTFSCPVSQSQYNLLYGNLDDVSTYGFAGSVCGVDADGSFTWPSPPAGNLFFLLVAENGALESSWGKKRTAGGESERSTSPSGYCGSTAIETTSTCP